MLASDATQIQHWTEHPAAMVRELFGVEPDKWQEEALEAFPHHQRVAMKACKGPGKTAVLAWLGWNFLLTRPHPKIGAISITGKNLEDGLWPEMAKWQKKDRSGTLDREFTWTKTRIFHNTHPETWFMSAKTWAQGADKEEQAKALAGFHADNVMFLIDESGGMPDAVMAGAEAALANAEATGIGEAHIVQAGNPTQLSGPLYRAFKSNAKRLWYRVEITGDPDSPKRSSRIGVEYARQQIEQYGASHPYVLVNIFGEFPPSSMNALIGPEEVRASMGKYYRDYQIGTSPKIMGIDVARFGDDQSVIFYRQGLQAFVSDKYRNMDSATGAAVVSRKIEEFQANAVFVDDTGGFGSGWIDNLRQLGRSILGVHFATRAHDPNKYANKRAEMYFDSVEWIRRGGALPDSAELLNALTQTTYTFQGDKLILEPKDMVKQKIGHSPDEADAFVLTFAEPVSVQRKNRASAMQFEYDPFAELYDESRIQRN